MQTGTTAKILARLEELHLNPRSASLKVSTNPDLFRNVIRQGDEANPTSETIEKMAEALQVGPEWFVMPDAAAGRPGALPTEVKHANVRVPPNHELPMDIEVLGTAAGSLIEGQFEGFQLQGESIDRVRRPPGLANVPSAYAIYVTGDSMWPMHSPGDLRFVHPARPAAPGDTVIVQTRHWEGDPGQGYIKILRRRKGDVLVLEQLNPPATIEIPVRYVVSVHRVPTMNELFGV